MAYEQHLTRGLQEAIDNTSIVDGKLRFAVDEARLFLDLGDERIEFTDFVKGLTQAQVFALTNPLPKLYLTSDTYQFMMFHAGRWYVFGSSGYDSDGQKVTETYVKDLSFNEHGTLIKTYGNGFQETVPTTELLLARITALENQVRNLTGAIQIINE